LTAVGTFGVAAAAVYFGGIRDRVRRPSLSLQFNPDDPFDRQLAGARQYVPWRGGLIGVGPVNDQAWLRLRVRDKPRRIAAEDVQVRVTDVRELEPRPDAPPATLRRPGGLPLVWANTGGLTTGFVPPGSEQPIDFAYVDKSAADSGAAPMVLVVNPPPADDRHMLISLRVAVGLTVTARNADPRHYQLVAFFDGDRGEDPWDHLAIESLSPVRARRL
jgi:hypothetical protein